MNVVALNRTTVTRKWGANRALIHVSALAVEGVQHGVVLRSAGQRKRRNGNPAAENQEYKKAPRSPGALCSAALLLLPPPCEAEPREAEAEKG